MMQDCSSRKFSERVKQIGLPLDGIVVIGSGILDQLGIRFARDVDLVANRELVSMLQENPLWTTSVDAIGRVVSKKGDVEVWDGWELDDKVADFITLTQDGVTYDDVRFVNLEFVLQWKRWRGREKDMIDVEKIRNYMRGAK